MLATIMLDAYGPDEKAAMAGAIERLCHPPGQRVFSRVGIYCYWDFDSRDVLYIGLSGDLYKRFRQHNGLIACEASCCKRQMIDDHFSRTNRIGLSLLLQSKMQDDGALARFDDWTLEEMVGVSDSLKNVQFAEGNLIDAHVRRYGRRPPWNGNSASKEGHGAPTVLRGSGFMASLLADVTGMTPKAPSFDILTDLVGTSLSPLVARNTVRELFDKEWNEITEDVMHGIRMMMIDLGVSYEQAAAVHKQQPQGEYVEWIEEENYLARVPRIFA